MTIIRILVILAWSLVALYMTPAVWSIFKGRPRTGDPARLMCFCFASIETGFALRWLLAPDSDELWFALYVLSIACALAVLWTARSYGRGSHV